MYKTNSSFTALASALFMSILVALIGATNVSATGSGCGISGITIYDLDHHRPVHGYENISYREHITINLDDMPDNFNIQVETFGNVESIHATLDGSTKIENHVPYRFPRGDHNAWNPSTGDYEFKAKAYKRNNASGTRCDTDTFDITVVGDSEGGNRGDLIAPSVLACDNSGDFLWENSIDLSNLQGSNGIPEAEVRFKRGATTQFSIPNLPAELNDNVTISVTDAVAWDGYTTRPSTNNQPNERFKIVFLKDGSVVNETYWTGNSNDDAIATGVSSAEWVGGFGSAEFPNGVDEIILVHWSDAEYGTGDTSNTNSVVPSSVCFNIQANTNLLD